MNNQSFSNSSRSSSLESIILLIAHHNEESNQEGEVAPISRRSNYSVSPYYTESSSSDEEEEIEVERDEHAQNVLSLSRPTDQEILNTESHLDLLYWDVSEEERNSIIEDLNILDTLIFLISHLLDEEPLSEILSVIETGTVKNFCLLTADKVKFRMHIFLLSAQISLTPLARI
ncbi:hypothetical protein CRE_24204 [Caenorhabditis remanei]|uniref:Uncharacterized protein n=1 Tax=Caenorhabditis remanei TaxID=31234 RepID=E3NCW3_CAERE|nr:hypothetical protein CRE_24204 [Caenorhabditis remanei]